MGVHGLWKIIEQTADPVKLETLRGKTLAIDASIWVYHFLKAMRDPRGTVLVAAHIIGFFRRICKLMFFEIRPVFVFDGSPPILKKQTTSKRSERRVGREQSARSAANKLLTIQLQRAAKQAKPAPEPTTNKGEVKVVGTVPKDAVYYEDLVTQGQPKANAPFVQTDQYHLPDVGKIGPVRDNDQRLLSEEELEEYSRQFTDQAQAGFIDTSLVDFHSAEFDQLPPETQYQLLNVARTKSRLRMGYTTEELNRMFPDRMEFSKFQIDRVAQRNFFTQKLINLMGMEEDLTRRVSSEKNKEYFLKKTDQGYALSLEDHQTGDPKKEEPRRPLQHKNIGSAHENHRKDDESVDESEDEDEDEFEDVDLEPDETQPQTLEDSTGNKLSPIESGLQESERRSPSIDELFGFEAKLTRERLYDRLYNMDSDDDEDAHEDISKVAQSKEDKEGKDANTKKKKNMPTVPWFEEQGNFEEMHLNEREQEHFVPLNYEPEHDEESIAQAPEEESSQFQQAIENSLPRHDNPTERPQLPSESSSQVEPSVEPSSLLHDVEEIAPIEVTPNDSGEDTKDAGFAPADKSVVPPSPQETQISQEKPHKEDLKVTEPSVGPSESLSEPHKGDKVDNKTASEEISLSPEAAERAEADAKEDEEEDEDIAGMLIAEAEENGRFAKELADQNHQQWSAANEKEYQTQISSLRNQFAQASRDADNVSTEMIQECQELLQLFGIPYITAPAEAEAQCAELHALKLVDGVVTDDGDTFLFEDNARVYRNMFSQAKFVEFYSTKRIRDRLGLDRRGMIDLAFLLGSDYTDGILGIGPVTGVEILAEFGGLREFSKWWSEAQRFPDQTILDTPLKRRLLKNFQTKLYLPDDFPNQAVVDAYLHPAIDSDAEKFGWGTPDLDGLRRFMEATAGWDAAKTDATLLPVVQESKRRDLLDKTERALNQSRLDDFYQSVVQNPDLGSKRANKAAGLLKKRKRVD